jgi:hypothetical protein
MTPINKLVEFLSHKAPPQKWLLWIVMGCILKIPVFYLLIAKNGTGFQGSFMLFNSDTYSYFDPIKNLITNGTYFDPETEGYRLPGYGVFYFLLHYIFSSPASIYNAIGVIQLSCNIISVYLVGRLAQHITRSNAAFYLAFLLHGISPFTSMFSSHLLTESLSASFLVFSFYFIYRSVNDKPGLVLPAGIFLTWSYFLRPSIFIIIPFVILFFLILIIKKRIALKYLFILLTPMVICSGLWVLHNYSTHHKLRLLTHTLYYPKIEKSYVKSSMEFFSAYGYPQIIMPFAKDGNVYYYLNFPRKDNVPLSV